MVVTSGFHSRLFDYLQKSIDVIFFLWQMKNQNDTTAVIVTPSDFLNTHDTLTRKDLHWITVLKLIMFSKLYILAFAAYIKTLFAKIRYWAFGDFVFIRSDRLFH